MQKVSSLMSKDINNYLTNKVTWSSFYNAKSYDLVGNGTTNDYTALNTLINTTINGAEATIIFPAGTYKLSSSITIPSNISLYFVKGAMLSPDSGVTVTINGPVEAGLWKIFTGSGTIAGSMKVDHVFPQWWGAKGDGVTIDTTAIQATVNYVNSTGTLFFPDGTYIFNIDLTTHLSKRINFQGGSKTIFKTTNTTPILTASPAAYTASNIIFRNIIFEGDAEGASPPFATDKLISFTRTNAKFYNCEINYAGKTGFYGLFSQYNEFHQCRFGGNGYAGVDISAIDGANRSNENLFDRCFFTANGRNIVGYQGAGIISKDNELTRLINCTIMSNYIGVKLAGGTVGNRGDLVDGCWFEINTLKSIELGINNENTNIVHNNFFEGETGARIMTVDAPYNTRIVGNYMNAQAGKYPLITGSGSGQSVEYLNNSNDIDGSSALTGSDSRIVRFNSNNFYFGDSTILVAGGMDLKGAPNHYAKINNGGGAFFIRDTSNTNIWYATHAGETFQVDNAFAKRFIPRNGKLTLTANSATPDVASSELFDTANSIATTITNFLNGVVGQNIRIKCKDANTTIANNANIVTKTGANITLTNGQVVVFIMFDSGVWTQAV